MTAKAPPDLPQLYAWMVQETDGEWGTIAATLPGMPGLTPLVTRRMEVANAFQGLAEGHARASGRPVRLIHFAAWAVLQTFGEGEG